MSGNIRSRRAASQELDFNLIARAMTRNSLMKEGVRPAASYPLIRYRLAVTGEPTKVDKVYVVAIQAGAAGNVGLASAIWAVPAVIIQRLGGPARQVGILLSTDLLILNPMAG